jgi:hypothetical protein
MLDMIAKFQPGFLHCFVSCFTHSSRRIKLSDPIINLLVLWTSLRGHWEDQEVEKVNQTLILSLNTHVQWSSIELDFSVELYIHNQICSVLLLKTLNRQCSIDNIRLGQAQSWLSMHNLRSLLHQWMDGKETWSHLMASLFPPPCRPSLSPNTLLQICRNFVQPVTQHPLIIFSERLRTMKNSDKWTYHVTQAPG